MMKGALLIYIPRVIPPDGDTSGRYRNNQKKQVKYDTLEENIRKAAQVVTLFLSSIYHNFLLPSLEEYPLDLIRPGRRAGWVAFPAMYFD